jgi:ABC-type ATPase involved in cell division
MVDVDIRDLTIEYTSGGYVVRPVNHLDLRVASGELALLLGASGSGKTTLLSAMAAILRPASGTIRVGDTEVTGLRGAALTGYRRHRVGVVFQTFNLVPSLTALDNVQASLWAAGMPARRALAHDQPLILADEPTAHLDHIQVEGVLRLLRALAGPVLRRARSLFGLQRSATARAVGHAVVTGYSPGDFRDLVGSGRVAPAIMGAGAAEGRLAPSRQARTPPCPGGPEGAK